MKQPTGWLEGNDLVLTRRFEAPIEDVWTSITKSESTARWYGSGTGTPGAAWTARDTPPGFGVSHVATE